jgi:hypothetical protein
MAVRKVKTMADDLDEMGPIDYVVVEFPGNRMTGEVLQPGSSAGILTYENAWAGPFAAAVRRSGGELVASGRIPVQAVLSAIDKIESGS